MRMMVRFYSRGKAMDMSVINLIKNSFNVKDVCFITAVPLTFNIVNTNHCYVYSKAFNFNPRHALPAAAMTRYKHIHVSSDAASMRHTVTATADNTCLS